VAIRLLLQMRSAKTRHINEQHRQRQQRSNEKLLQAYGRTNEQQQATQRMAWQRTQTAAIAEVNFTGRGGEAVVSYALTNRTSDGWAEAERITETRRMCGCGWRLSE